MTKSFWNKTSSKQLSVWELIIYRTWPKNPREYTSLQEDILYKSHIIIETIWKDVFFVSYPFPLYPSALFSLVCPVLAIPPETNSKRQATQYGCLPSLLGDRDKGIEIVYGEEKSILYWAYYRAVKNAEQNSCVPFTASPTNQPRKDSFLLYSLSPHDLPQFQQSAGSTPLWSLWAHHACPGILGGYVLSFHSCLARLI
jgi:hypothetical protein